MKSLSFLIIVVSYPSASRYCASTSRGAAESFGTGETPCRILNPEFRDGRGGVGSRTCLFLVAFRDGDMLRSLRWNKRLRPSGSRFTLLKVRSRSRFTGSRGAGPCCRRISFTKVSASKATSSDLSVSKRTKSVCSMSFFSTSKPPVASRYLAP